MGPYNILAGISNSARLELQVLILIKLNMKLLKLGNQVVGDTYVISQTCKK